MSWPGSSPPPRGEPATPLFRSVDPHKKVTANPMARTDVLRMVKRRTRAAGLRSSTCCHTFRATGITAYLENGGTIENAQAIRRPRVAPDGR